MQKAMQAGAIMSWVAPALPCALHPAGNAGTLHLHGGGVLYMCRVGATSARTARGRTADTPRWGAPHTCPAACTPPPDAVVLRYHIEYTSLFDQDLKDKISSRTVYCISAIFTVVLLGNIITFTHVCVVVAADTPCPCTGTYARPVGVPRPEPQASAARGWGRRRGTCRACLSGTDSTYHINLHTAVLCSPQSLCLMHTGKPTGVAVFHCITWFQTQLISTTCQIPYHSHLRDHRSTGQL